MDGRADKFILNHLIRHGTKESRVEDARLVADLVEHEGWEVVDKLVREMEARNGEELQKLAQKVAPSTDAEKAIDYARREGFQNAITYVHDVIASVLESGKTAAEQLRQAAADDAAEGK